MFKILTIPFNSATETFGEDILNEFCVNKLVKSHRTEFFQASGKSYWTVFLEYDVIIEKSGETEKAGLNEVEGILFDRLKQWRKERADKEGVPVYIIATNSEIRQIIKTAPRTLEALKTIKGFGSKGIDPFPAPKFF